MSSFELRQTTAEKLRPVAGEDAFLEAGFLQEYCERNPDADLQILIDRRLRGEPLQYVLGEWDFMGLTFHTDSRALIPRPDTETVCETALTLIRDGDTVLDMCCGSGCIGIAIAKNRRISLVSTDISDEALELTRENAELNGVVLKTENSDLFENVSGVFDCIICNPPYLTEKEMSELEPSMLFEPKQALYGGRDGLDFYRRISDSFHKHLKPGGALILEIGCFQEKDVKALFNQAECIKDYGGRPRCVVVRNND